MHLKQRVLHLRQCGRRDLPTIQRRSRHRSGRLRLFGRMPRSHLPFPESLSGGGIKVAAARF